MSRRAADIPHGSDITADKRGQSHQLVCSRRASDAVRARAAALNKATSTVLDEAIKLGLAAMPDPYRDTSAASSRNLSSEQPESAASSRNRAQGEPATGPLVPHGNTGLAAPSPEEPQ